VSPESAFERPSDPGPPPDIPDFDLIRPVGQGGFGRVWLARNRATGHLRAVKVIPLRRSGASDPAGREISSLSRLEASLPRRHPGLLNIHHVGKTAEHLFYVMDPADDLSGSPASSGAGYRPATLESRLLEGPLSPEDCERHARQLLEGLASLHDAGMVHRDVKPANCLFVGGELKLADFGLVTQAGAEISRVGTQKYMPPDGRMDARADVYAAGLVIYEMITGLPSGSFPRLGEKAARIARTPALRALARLALGACHPDPERRYRDARAMLAEMQAPAAESRSGRHVPWRRIVTSIAVLVLLLVMADTARRTIEPPLVHVNFITYPFEATIYLDGVRRMDAAGRPYRTPCTLGGLQARPHRVIFQHDKLGEIDEGMVDFARTRQIVARWGSR